MKAAIIQSIQILSLIFVMTYDAEAQPVRPLAGSPLVSDICDIELAGRGHDEDQSYRIILKGQVLDGAEHLDEISAKLDQLQQAGICRQRIDTECSLVPAGAFNGSYFNIRVERAQQIFAGGSKLEEVVLLLEDLQAHRVCSVAVQHCELASGGLISSGHFMKQRLMVNGEPLFGANDLGTLQSQMNRLRLHNICD